ncbi:hypothetical protein HHX47_DHR9000110 [Lentinula edodes]|nr:hypothetical protein HHX47_DHR9000110 [Lentinula edodes]
MSTPDDHTNTLSELKREIASSYGSEFQTHITKAWSEIIHELSQVTESISRKGSEYIPQVNLSELSSLSPARLDEIRRIGTVVIKDVVDDKEARAWQESLKEFIKANPDVPGFPANNKQFFELYWTKPQVEARSHPNVLAASTWLNNLYRNSSPSSEKPMEDTQVEVGLLFRLMWMEVRLSAGKIQRSGLASTTFFLGTGENTILTLSTVASKLVLPCITELINFLQASVFRTFQGWLAMSETAPTEGTLKVFPDVLLSNAYIILRPFFRPLVSVDSAEILDPNNWSYDISYADFPGIYPKDGGFAGPWPTSESHPHLMLDKTMISVPKVMPGDTVFWHCDVVHSVEVDHTGQEDSAVMYIPAVPTTPMNKAYVEKQKECFLKSINPPDFPKGSQAFYGISRTAKDLLSPAGAHAMGLSVASSA